MAKIEAVDRPELQDRDAVATSTPQPAKARKPLVRPELVRHGSLPQVTGAFIGTFSP